MRGGSLGCLNRGFPWPWTRKGASERGNRPAHLPHVVCPEDGVFAPHFFRTGRGSRAGAGAAQPPQAQQRLNHVLHVLKLLITGGRRFPPAPAVAWQIQSDEVVPFEIRARAEEGTASPPSITPQLPTVTRQPVGYPPTAVGRYPTAVTPPPQPDRRAKVKREDPEVPTSLWSCSPYGTRDNLSESRFRAVHFYDGHTQRGSSPCGTIRRAPKDPSC